MAKLDLALVVRMVDQATAPLRRIQRSVREVGRQTGLDRVGRNLRAVGRGLNNVGREAGRFGRRFGLLAGGAGLALGALTNSFAQRGDEIAKTADRTGIPIERLQELFHAFDIGGVGKEETKRALLFFNRAIGEAARGSKEYTDIFNAMGVDIYDSATGKLRPTGEILDDVTDAMANQESPAKRAAAAQFLFGRAGIRLTNVLSEGSEQLAATGAEMDALGKITEQEARQAEQYVDERTRMFKALEGIANAIGARLVPALIPAIQNMRDFFVAIKPGVLEEVDKLIRNVNGALDWLGRHLGFANTKLGEFRGWLRETFPAVDSAIDRFTKWADEIGWLTVAVGAVTFFLGRGLIGAILKLVSPLARLAFSVGAVAFRLTGLVAKVALGLGRLAVAGVMRPLGSVRRLFGATGRGLGVLARAVATGLGSLGVAGVLRPLASVRRLFGATGRGLGVLARTGAAGLGVLGVSGLMRPIAAVRRVLGATGRGLAVLSRAVVAGLGALGVAGVLRPLGAVRRLFGATGRGLAVLGRAVVAGLGLLGVGGLLGPLRRVRSSFGATTAARKAVHADATKGAGRLNVAGILQPLRRVGTVFRAILGVAGRLAAGFLGGPIGWIITGALLLWEFWGPISGWWDGVWKGLKDTWDKSEWVKGIGATFERQAGYVRRAWNAFGAWWSNRWAGLRKTWEGVTWITDIGKAFDDEIKYVTSKFETFRAYLADFFETGPGGAAGAIAGRNAGARPAPSLFGSGGGAADPAIRNPRAGGRAHVTVDFRHTPPGTRTEGRADDDTDLEVITGYAMQGAY